MGRNDTILKVKNLTKEFYKNKKLFTAVDHISFQLQKGECLGIVGESGCGKTTTIKMITQLLKADSGEIWVDGKQIAGQKQQNRKEIKNLYTKIQMVFQTPQDSFDPRQTLGDGIMESVYNHRMSKKEARMRMEQLLQQVELPLELAERYPHQVSGGQCQRAAIARALAIAPDILICDEATSALDVTVQAQIVDLLKADNDILQAVTGQDPFQIGYKTVETLVQSIEGKDVADQGKTVIVEGRPLRRGDTKQLDDFMSDLKSKM